MRDVSIFLCCKKTPAVVGVCTYRMYVGSRARANLHTLSIVVYLCLTNVQGSSWLFDGRECSYSSWHHENTTAPHRIIYKYLLLSKWTFEANVTLHYTCKKTCEGAFSSYQWNALKVQSWSYFIKWNNLSLSAFKICLFFIFFFKSTFFLPTM